VGRVPIQFGAVPNWVVASILEPSAIRYANAMHT
jgi:hypothetical protein